MRQDLDPVQRKEAEQRATALTAWALASDTFIADDAVRAFRSRGFGRYIKTGDVLTSDEAGVSLLPLTAAFLGLTDAESLIGQLTGALHLPLGSSARVQVGAVTASAVSESQTKPIERLSFAVVGGADESDRASRHVGGSDAVAEREAQAGIRQTLVSAVADATDGVVLTALATGTLVGTATAAALLSAISNGQPRKPFLIGGYDVLLAPDAGAVRDLQALGVGVLPSGMAAGQLFAVDAAGVLIEDGGVTVATARDATMTLNGSPTNLWTANLSAIRAERLLRVTVRAGASAYTAAGSPA